MTYRRQVTAQIYRFGQEVDVLERSESGRDAFNNKDWSFTETGTAVCMRTYDNRNTEIQSNSGDRHRDSPLLLFPTDEVPDSDARIRYEEPDGSFTVYELQAPTRYETHVEIFADVVVN